MVVPVAVRDEPPAETTAVAVQVAAVVPARPQCSTAVALTSTPAVFVVAALEKLYSLAFSVTVATYR